MPTGVYKRKEVVRICSNCGKNTGRIINSRKHKMVLCNRCYQLLDRRGYIPKITSKDRNKIIIYDDYAEIEIRGMDEEIICFTKIDIKNIDKVKDYKWNINDSGYVICNGFKIRLHRLITDCPDDKVVDHINHDILDNRENNLKVCTIQENNINRKNVKGIWYSKQIKRWIAYIGVNHKRIHLGCFKNKEEAIKARKEAEEKYFGEFAYKDLKALV